MATGETYNYWGDPNVKNHTVAGSNEALQKMYAAAKQGTPAAASATPAGQTPAVDPMAIQLFFANSIAPMLQGLAGKLGDQNKQFTDMAQANLQHFQMPESYKAIFGQSIPRQAAAQNDVIASLMGAAATAPALDQLMQAVNQARAASTKDYIDQQLYGGAGGSQSFLGQLLAGGAGGATSGG